MQKKFRFSDHVINFKLLGSETGGFNDKYTDPKIAASNMDALAKSFDSKNATLMLAECHTKIVEVTKEMEEVRADVLITYNPFHALMLRPADCIPLLIFSRDSPMLALVHCSRQGLEKDIIAKTLAFLKKRGYSPKNLEAYIGPSIKRESYRLPLAIIEKLSHPTWVSSITVDGKNALVDIAEFARLELIRLGIAEDVIEISPVDTAATKDYYSHYRSTRFGEPNGRNGVVAAISSSSQ